MKALLMNGRFGALAVAALVALGLGVPNSANALAMHLQMEFISGNACSGVFGQGFSNCVVPAGSASSPSIIKFDDDLDVDEISTNFPSIDGAEFLFSGLGTGNGTGTWNYTAGAGDPGIRFWSAKASNGFNLFYYTPNMVDIRDNALIVTSGTWITPLNTQGRPRGLSNLVFYDTRRPPTVDEPATLVLLGLAMLGLGLGGRRRSKRR